ncbi:MAG: hypothetical protein VXW26_12655, partial [SAR324 cluster bacterium]|nr:hypothetical protein [SAR324 cluster bacterium]
TDGEAAAATAMKPPQRLCLRRSCHSHHAADEAAAATAPLTMLKNTKFSTLRETAAPLLGGRS